jgi:ribosomal protein L39E
MHLVKKTTFEFRASWAGVRLVCCRGQRHLKTKKRLAKKLQVTTRKGVSVVVKKSSKILIYNFDLRFYMA